MADVLVGRPNRLIPICTTFKTAVGTSYTKYKQIGTGFRDLYNAIPSISGKTKRVRLLIDIYTNNNFITVGLKRQSDTTYFDVINNIRIWGGTDPTAFSSIRAATIDPSYLDAYTTIYMKSDNENAVAIGSIVAEVYFE